MDNSDIVTLQFDQYSRYTVVAEILRLCFSPGEPSLLDIGAGPSELTPRFLSAFYKSRISTDVEDFARNDIVVVPPGAPLPYGDGHFDVAIAMDVLEHVRPEHRAFFITEAVRVSRVAVIGTPIGNDETRLAESMYEAGYRDLYNKPLTFLEEHTEFGLPVSDEVIALGRQNGASVYTTDCAPLDEWLASNLVDLYLSTVNDGYCVRDFLYRKMNQSLPIRNPGERHYRRFYIFTRDDALGARLAGLPASSEPSSGGWDGRRAQLIMARLFRDYAAAYDAPFVDKERIASREKDRHISQLTTLVNNDIAALRAEKHQAQHDLEVTVQERDIAYSRLTAFGAKRLFRRLGVALRNNL